MKEEVAIKVENVSKTFRIPHEKISTLRGAFVNAFRPNGYEEFNALDDVSFEVKKGEFFGIIGRNGSGKSTLLKILAGIYQPDKGSVKINGLISPFLELGIGFNPELSGRDNIYLNAAVLGLSHKQIGEKFDDIVEFSELRRFIDQKVKNYSSGMQVRLAFSVAIYANRDILLMDEVLAVGDVNFQQKCIYEFSKYKKLGKTVLLVTHDILTVQKYCDRAMLLREGKIQMIGSPEKVGHEYIYQNMSDEEKRITEEEKRRRKKAEREMARRKKDETKKDKQKSKDEIRIQSKEKLFRQRVAEVAEVSLFDKDNKEKNVFKTGEVVGVKVIYNIHEPIEDPVFGIMISDLRGINTLITNTDFKRVKTGFFEPGKIEVNFNIENYFSTGQYNISPAIAAKGAKIFYDWKDSAKSFIIAGDYNSNGVADFKHSINIIRKK